MGSDREQHQEPSPEKVFLNIYKDFGLTKRQIFDAWVAYNNRRGTGANPRQAINQMHNHPEMYPIEILNYFLVIGLELFNKEYMKEFENVRCKKPKTRVYAVARKK